MSLPKMIDALSTGIIEVMQVVSSLDISVCRLTGIHKPCDLNMS